MASIILLNKPFGILSQFSGDDPSLTLTPLITRPKFYPAGRLDKDSEGLLLLTDDGKLQQQISDPRFNKEKTYWVQVEGDVNETALNALPAHKRLGPNHEFQKIGPLRALSQTHKNVKDDGQTTLTFSSSPQCNQRCFCQQHWLQMSKYSPKAFVSASNIVFLMR